MIESVDFSGSIFRYPKTRQSFVSIFLPWNMVDGREDDMSWGLTLNGVFCSTDESEGEAMTFSQKHKSPSYLQRARLQHQLSGHDEHIEIFDTKL